MVEDEPVLRDMAHLILQDCGYQVLEAGSGAEALQVWERNPDAIDLVLTDMVMPGGMSGRDLAAKLLANQPQLKIIFTSGYNVEEANTDFFRRRAPSSCRNPIPAWIWLRSCAKAWTSRPAAAPSQLV